MSTTQTHTPVSPGSVTVPQLIITAAESEEAQGTVWVDFGDGGSARWAGLSLRTLDEVCAHLETVKPADTIT
ncbi:hypothetical protein F0Q45_10335 [Mycobacterium simiae]|uniref:Uncharacterized protein n=1 Tax=Mycobacterium simiae TaxID=1784 RepID=A0A5B1BNX2_MYCSI|nr:hypothetical protein [Mycobacterium simiae]KAA1250327.1 hypothetical protein F0Q45_10335 [Mycobacterium simiae]